MKQSEVTITLPVIFCIESYLDMIDCVDFLDTICKGNYGVRVAMTNVDGNYVGLIYKKGEKPTKAEIKKLYRQQNIELEN